MKEDLDFIEQFDMLLKGDLSQQDAKLLSGRIDKNAALKKIAEEHSNFISTLKRWHQRKELHIRLREFQNELEDKAGDSVDRFGRYLLTLTSAAAVIAIAVVFAIWMTFSIRPKEQADYKELRRNVEQIKRSQSLILADLATAKGKIVPSPGKYAGTGFLISSDGYIVTSSHVIAGADSVIVESGEVGRVKAEVAYADFTNDIAILRIEALKKTLTLPWTISPSEASLGENVFTIGFPRDDIVYGDGTVSATTGFRGNINSYQISIPVNPGNSGGPLLNSNGDLIGVITGAQTATTGAAFAIKSSMLLTAINNIQTNPPAVFRNRNTIRHLSRVEQIKIWRKSIFMVRVFK